MDVWNKVRLFILGLGLTYVASTFIIFTWLFLEAYQSPDKTLLIGINWYGEAKAELIIISFLLGPAAYFLMWSLIKVYASEDHN